jgi:hypothetical protein
LVFDEKLLIGRSSCSHLWLLQSPHAAAMDVTRRLE